MPSFDEFLDDEMHGVEVHPVHDGDQSDGDRYKVVHKFGHGATSTVFLARDLVIQIYVAVKITESCLCKPHIELDISNHLFKVKSDDHAGWSYSATSILLRHTSGYTALMADTSLSFHHYVAPASHTYKVTSLYRSEYIDLQVTQDLEYLHSEDIWCGDFTSSDVIFQLSTN